jgi:shikimate kinase
MTTALTLDSVVRAAGGKLSTRVGPDLVVLDVDSDRFFGLEGTGPAIWALLAEPRTVRELRDALSARFEVSPDDCERDLFAFLSELATDGLVTVVAADPGAEG